MPIRIECPFLITDSLSKHGTTHISWEFASMCFPNKDECDIYIKRYCASLHGWKDCTIAKATEDYYERTDTK